ncbi:MAG: M48 family metalloprotease [Sphaerospermopsis sp. SIO1G2]|nr:M48 family metalloprotease [Sphaerospermopsis sp. SIO1G2]
MPNNNNLFIQSLTTCSLVVSVLLSNVLDVQAKPKSQQNVKPTTSTSRYDIYKQAKEKLPEDYYVLYRIVDRLARANGLDNGSWRVVVDKEYNINAFATDVNLLAFYNGLIDQLEGDPSALACVVGHEMAHHTKRHIALSQAEQEKMIAKFQAEAEAEVMKETQSAKDEATSSAIGGALLNTFGNAIGGSGGMLGNIGGGLLSRNAQNRVNLARKRIPQIVEQKEQEFKQKMAENSRKNEFEADELGYKYMATAGFEAEGCLRVMEVLARTPGSEFDTTHPAIPKRIEQLKTLMSDYPAVKLAQEGKQKLNTVPPLTYNLSRDNSSLRINSRRGGSSADSIEKMFDN